MFSIEKHSLPHNALLARYARDGIYTDCYATDFCGAVSHADFVRTFYTTWLFKLERVILKWTVSRPSTDVAARQLAEGAMDTFAAWYVEKRAKDQILMCDFRKRTRSWLMVAPLPADGGARTRLYFGSAVVPIHGEALIGPGFRALIGLHKLYSEALLYSAKSLLKTRAS